MNRACLRSVAHALPARRVTNADIVARMDTTEAFILERTGVVERRHVEPGQGTSDLMIEAAGKAIAGAGIEARAIDLVIVTTLSPDHHDPSQANFIQPRLGVGRVPVFDIRAQCSGFLYATEIASQYVQTGRAKNVLVISGEVLSKRMDCSRDGRNLAILLGDGAGAAIVQRATRPDSGFLDQVSGADGLHFHDLWTAAPGTGHPTFAGEEIAPGAFEFRMNGRALFDHAVAMLVSSAREILERNRLTPRDVDIVVSHQPNVRILEAVRDELKVDADRFLITADKIGNIASASLPVSIALAMEQRRIVTGTLALLLTYGAGSTWSAALHRF